MPALLSPSSNYHEFVIKVLEYARQYYNCPTLQYVPLENEGGSGSASLVNIHTYFALKTFSVLIVDLTGKQGFYSKK